ncbi:MAG: pyruvate dehydrogenase complex dihydrolipoamide acetyltransferase [Alphaproteobacteria bacterium]
MPIDILMPALSPTMTEGKLARWLVKTGDIVSPGDVIAEIETDKATMEVEAVDEGLVAQILVAEGTENVAVNSVIAVLKAEGENDAAPIKLAAPLPLAAPVAKVTAAPTPSSAPAMLTTGQGNPLATTQPKSRLFASPLAKRLAKNAGLDLANIKGTGPHGRIVRKDVEKAQTSPATPAIIAAPAAGKAPVAASLSAAKQLADAYGMRYKEVPNSSVRKVIARRLTESKQNVPHFYLTIETDITALLDWRQKINARGEVKLSVNDFVIKAVALALKKVPAANVAWGDDSMLQFEDADISVAVATPNGLITPIIKTAQKKSLSEISAQMKDLAARARDNKLKPEEFQGGTFSISNLGMFGIKEFGAIINPPQACILAVGTSEQKPVVRDGAIEIASIMSCTLSVDHRAVDGAVGAEFLAAFKKLIEDPLSLLV